MRRWFLGSRELEKKIKLNSISEVDNHESYLDGLRGIAILMVVMFHTSLAINSNSYFRDFSIVIEHLSRGVQLFFILSAFTLFRSTVFRKAKSEYTILSFYVRRFFRIIPLWWLATLLYSQIWMPGKKTSDILAVAFLYFGVYKDAWEICFIPVGWSLFVEESFYLFFPFIHRYITNIKIALILFIVSLILSYYWFGHFSEYSFSAMYASISPMGNYFAFFLGILLYFTQIEIGKREWLKNYKVLMLSLDVLACAGIVSIFFVGRIAGTLCFIPLLISSFFETTLFGKLTRTKILGKFGVCCYSIYLFHGPLIGYISVYQQKYFGFFKIDHSPHEIKTFFWFILTSICSLILGVVLFHLLEMPSVRIGKTLIKRLKL